MNTMTREIAAHDGEDGHTVFVSLPSPDPEGGVIPASICIDSKVDLSPGQAREVAAVLTWYAEQVDPVPAGEDGLRALTVMLDALNDGRGTSHTVESVATSLGMEQPLSRSEASEIARHIGGVLMHA